MRGEDGRRGTEIMALTNNNLEMIKALANNDVHKARVAALASLVEDKSKKNAGVVDRYRKMFAGNGSTMLSNLPADIKTFLVGEAPGGFDPARYYVRDSEARIKMKLVADMLAEKKIPYRNTTLLYGESGTGKTELGRYIAYKLGLPFFYISFSSMIDSYMGSTAKNINKVFNFCNSIPCVLMLDEVDCIATRRASSGSRGADGELERTTISIMQELDRIPSHVTLIAATNRLDIVDEALLRRFSIKHEVKNMTYAELTALAVQFLEATDTRQYVKDEDVLDVVTDSQNPGQVMPELVRLIGKRIYEEKKDEVQEKLENEDDTKPDLFEVTYTWKQTVSAETEEDAISIARNNRSSYYNSGTSSEEYSAKRAEYIAPN